MRLAKIGSSLCLLCGAVLAQPAAPPYQCAALVNLQVPGVALTVTKAERIPAVPAPVLPGGAGSAVNLPAYCRLDGVIDRRTGAD
ncbi:MAG: hypothetical protein ACLP66_05945, partial [Polyangia bacterium]